LGELKLGKGSIECAVLEDGTRLISQRSLARAFGAGVPSGSRREDNLPAFLSSKNLKPFISDELKLKTAHVEYLMHGGAIAHGIRAETLPLVCDVWLRARDAGALFKRQKHLAEAADIITRGLAHVGIIALVDEATGYQDDRDRRALAKILEAFVAKELRPWVHTFPADYYREMYRLRGLSYPPTGNRMPRYFGVLTNDVVYSRLAPGVLEELKRTTPRTEKGRLKQHLHRRLTDDIGHPKLLQHLGAVVAVMRMSQDNDWKGFIKVLDKYYPRYLPAPLFEESSQKALPEGNGETV
jgi:hypothetical protein